MYQHFSRACKVLTLTFLRGQYTTVYHSFSWRLHNQYWSQALHSLCLLPRMELRPYGAHVTQLPLLLHRQQQQSELRPQHYCGIQYEVHPQFGIQQYHQAEALAHPRIALPQYHRCEVQMLLATPGYGNQTRQTGGMHPSPASSSNADYIVREGDEGEHAAPSGVSLLCILIRDTCLC